MQVLAHLIRYFSTHTAVNVTATDRLSIARIKEIINYVEEHFCEQISLQDIADHLGLGKEYFCRFFKKIWECLFFIMSMKYGYPRFIGI